MGSQIQKHNVEVKTNIEENNNNSFLLITIIWKIFDLEITWNGFDMEFQEFFIFLSQIKNNGSCHLGGGSNSFWSLDHVVDSKYCTFIFNISGTGGDSTLELKINNDLIIDTIEKICNEIDIFRNKYPDKTKF